MSTRIAIDLDNTIFNLAEKYRAVVESHHCKYTPPISYDVYKCGYPTHVADALSEMLKSDAVYKTNVFDRRLPQILNSIYTDPKYMLFYITERDFSHGCDLGQLMNAGIRCDVPRLVNYAPKIDILKRYKIDLCFDDAPHVVNGCVENNIDVVMISNEDTVYNHYLRGRVEHYPNLVTALMRRGMAR